ncbi:MAG: hypothetical protein WAN36_17020, partial [Calditrichia bacterium]
FNLNINYPADFEFTFADQFVDSAENWAAFPQNYPTKFSVYNSTEGRDASFQFQDTYEKDNTLSPYYPWQNPDSIEGAIILIDDPQATGPLKFKSSWRLFFEADTTLPQQIPPAPGDVFRIATKKPFRSGDEITFTVSGQGYNAEKAKADLDKIAVVPNPYVVAASWESRSAFRFGRGERKIEFINLPQKCTIRIYTLRGYLVDTIHHNTAVDDGSEPWNMLSKDGQEIAYGIYIFHVDAGSLGEKVGKFAVVK